jgi:hypothetical protein
MRYERSDDMTAKQVVEMAVAYAGITNSELARRLGWSPQLLNKRLNTGKFTVEEWVQIGEALGAKARVGFDFPDGKEI